MCNISLVIQSASSGISRVEKVLNVYTNEVKIKLKSIETVTEH